MSRQGHQPQMPVGYLPMQGLIRPSTRYQWDNYLSGPDLGRSSTRGTSHSTLLFWLEPFRGPRHAKDTHHRCQLGTYLCKGSSSPPLGTSGVTTCQDQTWAVVLLEEPAIPHFYSGLSHLGVHVTPRWSQKTTMAVNRVTLGG